MKRALGFALICLSAVGSVRAGETADAKLLQPLAEAWQFQLGIPVWLAGVQGVTGIRGHDAGVNVSAGTILRHLNLVGSFSVEARKGAFGFYGDFLYLDDRAGVSKQGMVSSLALRVDEYLADAEVNWRLLERPWGWLELRAGCRYTNLFTSVGLNPDGAEISRVSEELTEVASMLVGRVLDHHLKGVLNGKTPELPLPPLAAGVRDRMVKAIQKAKQDPELAAALQSGDAARIAWTKRRAQREISGILQRELSRTYTLGRDWFDPYLGLAGRYDFSRPFYLVAKADAGGFGVGSHFTWQAYGALGWQIRSNVFAEAGYRYLYVDYARGGFVYDVATRGAQMTLGVNF